MCNCPGRLDSGLVCKGCNTGNDIRQVLRSSSAAAVWDHVVGSLWEECMKHTKWDTSNCRCNGACDIANRSTKRPWAAPSVLYQIDAMHEVDETNLTVR